MVKVLFDYKFKELFSKIKDSSLKERIIKQITKIKKNPEVGKPMRNVRKGTRELYIKPFRLSYRFDTNKNIVEILNLYHKDEQ
jgi:mRNA-degrading endonuclease RelE of RelBE toxin-antitoxin system